MGMETLVFRASQCMRMHGKNNRLLLDRLIGSCRYHTRWKAGADTRPQARTASSITYLDLGFRDIPGLMEVSDALVHIAMMNVDA